MIHINILVERPDDQTTIVQESHRQRFHLGLVSCLVHSMAEGHADHAKSYIIRMAHAILKHLGRDLVDRAI